ncbi:MAG: cobalamin-dependent protein [Planctomycetota bacterium]
MADDITLQRFFEILTEGDRPAARQFVDEQREKYDSPTDLVGDLFWPVYELSDRLYREDQLTPLTFNVVTRLLRVMLDRVGADENPEPQGESRRILAVCGPTDADELGAQMAVDLIEAAGNLVVFAGGGMAFDEVHARVQETQPDVLLIFCSAPSDLPHIRQTIDLMREIGACQKTQIVVGGGVFNRAEGLAQEIGADLWAEDPIEVVDMVVHEAGHRAPEDQRTVGRIRGRSAA